MSFCTVINCMDGRTQLPVIEFLRQRYSVDYVDSVTEPAPVKILAEQADQGLLDSICRRLDVSVDKHSSKTIAIVAHHDCAGNPVAKDVQLGQLDAAVGYIAERYPEASVIGLWVDKTWMAQEVSQ